MGNEARKPDAMDSRAGVCRAGGGGWIRGGALPASAFDPLFDRVATLAFGGSRRAKDRGTDARIPKDLRGGASHVAIRSSRLSFVGMRQTVDERGTGAF